MAWIKTQEGRLVNVVEVFVENHEWVQGCASSNRSMPTRLGDYNSPVGAELARDDIERWLVMGADGVFNMPGANYPESPFFGPIDVEKAAESIFKSCRSIGPVVTTIPIPDSVMHFKFTSPHRKDIAGVSFDKATNIVSVEFDDPDGDSFMQFVRDHRRTPTTEAPVKKCCNTCGNAPGGPACIGCIARPISKPKHLNWIPRSDK